MAVKKLKYLDQEEKELIEAIEKNRDQDIVDTSPETLEYYRQIAINTRKNNKLISLRLQSEDIDKIKKRAEIDGLPYQTLISSIIHRYNNGRLIEVTDEEKSKKSHSSPERMIKHQAN